MISNLKMIGVKGTPTQHVVQLSPSTRFAIGGQIAFSPLIVGAESCSSGPSQTGLPFGDHQLNEYLNRGRGRSRISGACVTCAAAKKACDEVRPCTRFGFSSALSVEFLNVIQLFFLPYCRFSTMCSVAGAYAFPFNADNPHCFPTKTSQLAHPKATKRP
jgi:hypothetical protein